MNNNDKKIITIFLNMTSTTTLQNMKLKIQLVYGETKRQIVLGGKLNEVIVYGVIQTLVIL